MLRVRFTAAQIGRRLAMDFETAPTTCSTGVLLVARGNRVCLQSQALHCFFTDARSFVPMAFWSGIYCATLVNPHKAHSHRQ